MLWPILHVNDVTVALCFVATLPAPSPPNPHVYLADGADRTGLYQFDNAPIIVAGVYLGSHLRRDLGLVGGHANDTCLPDDFQKKLEAHKNEALGCVRFIASLSKVDRFVMLDRSLTVHGFGVELRSASELTDISVAGDSQATTSLLRPASLSQFGTRHRAMMRYCYENEGALGFVISQDGDIRATTKVGEHLVLWENINVQLAFKTENRGGKTQNLTPMMGLFRVWSHAVGSLASSSPN